MDRRLIWGGGFLVSLGAAAVLAPWLGLRDPAAQPDGLVLRDLPPLSTVTTLRLASGELRYAHEARTRDDGAVEYRRGETWTTLEPAELASDWRQESLFLLGTDDLGRDLLSRLAHGARVSLAVGLLSALLALTVGTLVGFVAALAGTSIDALLMRFTDLVLSIPRLFLALMLVGLWDASPVTTVVVLMATTWMTAARLVRGEILSLREREFTHAARAAGASPLRIALVHLLPAALIPVSVEGTLRVGEAILLEAALSFLGLGVQPPVPSWGNLVAEGRHCLLDAWWIATLPGLAIVATVVAVNQLGDGLRERAAPSPVASSGPGS